MAKEARIFLPINFLKLKKHSYANSPHIFEFLLKNWASCLASKPTPSKAGRKDSIYQWILLKSLWVIQWFRKTSKIRWFTCRRDSCCCHAQKVLLLNEWKVLKCYCCTSNEKNYSIRNSLLLLDRRFQKNSFLLHSNRCNRTATQIESYIVF